MKLRSTGKGPREVQYRNTDCTMSSTAGRETLPQRRSNSQILTSLHIPPRDDSEPVRAVLNVARNLVTDEETKVVTEGAALFKEFLYDEIKKESPQDLETATHDLVQQDYQRNVFGCRNPFWADTGYTLRQLADEFDRSRERTVVHERADRVDVNATYEQFRDLLEELFAEGGVTPSRIVVLFFFCSDVAIRALRTGVNLFQQFLNWSLSFIAERVCQWVYEHGGWGKVLRSPFNSLYKVCLWAAGFSAIAVVIMYYRPRIFF